MKFKFLPHTADIKFKAFGKSISDAFKNSAYALKETILSDKLKIKPKIKKEIEIKGNDFSSLLYNFLEEFLFLLDSENFVLSKIQSIYIDKKNFRLKAIIFGDDANDYEFRNSVKAITYSEMEVKKEKNKWICQVVLDV